MTSAQLYTVIARCQYSQKRFAEALGISERHLRRFLAGERPIPRLMELAVNSLCYRSGIMPPGMPR